MKVQWRFKSDITAFKAARPDAGVDESAAVGKKETQYVKPEKKPEPTTEEKKPAAGGEKKKDEGAPSGTPERIAGELCRDDLGQFVGCNSSKARKGDRERLMRKQADIDKALSSITSSETAGLSVENAQALLAFSFPQDPQALTPEQQDSLIKLGLVEVSSTGDAKISSAGRSFLSSIRKGDAADARDALTDAKANRQSQVESEEQDRISEEEKKKKEEEKKAGGGGGGGGGKGDEKPSPEEQAAMQKQKARMFEDALTQLMMGEDIDPAELKQYIVDGLIKRTPEGFKLTPEGAKLIKEAQGDVKPDKPKPDKPKPDKPKPPGKRPSELGEDGKPVPKPNKPKPDEPIKSASSAKAAMELTFTPPPAVRRAAVLALEVRRKSAPSNRGMTAVGVARARDLSGGRPLSLNTIRRMVSYFARHAVDKEGSTWAERGKGWQAWQGWGGDAGHAWAKRILSRVEGDDE